MYCYSIMHIITLGIPKDKLMCVMLSYICWHEFFCLYERYREKWRKITILLILNSPKVTEEYSIHDSTTINLIKTLAHKFNLSCSGNGICRSQLDMLDGETELFRTKWTYPMTVSESICVHACWPIIQWWRCLNFTGYPFLLGYYYILLVWAPSVRTSYEKGS